MGKETSEEEHDASYYREFAVPFGIQLRAVLGRVFQQYWRTPEYIYSKYFLIVSAVSLSRVLFVALLRWH